MIWTIAMWLVVPLAIGYAILKHNLFDVDAFIRKSVSYLLTTGGAVIIFYLVVGGLSLVVLDVMMPGKVGYQVCEEIKKDPATRHAYVIFLSARGRPVSEQTGKQYGGDAYMIKPFDPAELRAKVEEALEGK